MQYQKTQTLWLVRLYFLLGLFGGIIAAWMLLAIPTDQKNSVLWGYSPIRITFMIFIIVGILVFLALLFKSMRNIN